MRPLHTAPLMALMRFLVTAVVVADFTSDACASGSDGAQQCEAFGDVMVQRGVKTQTAASRATFLDVDTCAAQGPVHGRFALVASYAGEFLDELLPHLLKLRTYGGWADVVVLTTAKDAMDFSKEQLTAFSVNKVKLMRTDEVMAPELLQQFSHPGKCDSQQLVGLHALALEGYDGVALYSHDAEPSGDIQPLLMCAAAGHVITANNGVDKSSAGIDFVAARPDRRLFQAVISLASTIASSKGCGKDLLEALVDTDSNSTMRAALAEAGLMSKAGAPVAAEIDSCIWNYRAGQFCGDNFDTSRIRVKRGTATEGALQSQNPVAFLARDPSFGFWFPVFNEVSSVLQVVGNVRLFYPEAPIHLLSDGGTVDFTEVCQRPKYNCSFEMTQGENSRWNPHSWFRRMREGVQKLGTDYVIYLEPDVFVRKRHMFPPEHDAGGVFDNYNPTLGQHAIEYLERMGRRRNPDFKVLWAHFGLTGGSYFRSEAILDAFAPEHISQLDFVGLHADIGEPAWSSDLAMHLALSARGWVVYPWKDCGQRFQDAPSEADIDGRKDFAKLWPAFLPASAFEHDHKEHYSEVLDSQDASLIHLKQDAPPDVTCHGCVWNDYDNHPLPFPSDAPLPQNEGDRFTKP